VKRLLSAIQATLVLALIFWPPPASALNRDEVTVTATTACSHIKANNYVLINDGPADVHWECSGETVATTNKAALKSTDGPISVFESCEKLCYKTTSGTATLRIFSSPR
jgi:hypothetical protein